METINLSVGGMTCSRCVKQVENLLNLITGVEKVEVDLQSGSVKVEGKISERVEEMIAVIVAGGYTAQVSINKLAPVKVKTGGCQSKSTCCCN